MQKVLPRKNDKSIANIEEKLAETQMLVDEMTQMLAKNLKKIAENLNETIYTLRIELAKLKSNGFEPSILLEFPDHLRLTVRALLDLGIATAEEVSKKTHRSRSLESSYLNQLMRMGYVEKERKGQFAYYKMKFDTEKTKRRMK